jgi:hypothetical protein
VGLVLTSPPDVFRWGYEDTEFALTEDGKITLKGEQYPFSGLVFPDFRPWIEKTLGINVEDQLQASKMATPAPAIRNAGFISGLERIKPAKISFEDVDRVFHGHGHTCQEVLGPPGYSLQIH